MSWTIEWMKDWISAQPKRNQALLAAFAEVDPANVSRWLRLRSKPELEAVERICSKLEREEGVSLTIAWLRDHLPTSMEGMIRIAPEEGGGSPRVGEEAFPEGMSQELKERLLFFGYLALNNPDVRQIMDVCYSAGKRLEEASRRLGEN